MCTESETAAHAPNKSAISCNEVNSINVCQHEPSMEMIMMRMRRMMRIMIRDEGFAYSAMWVEMCELDGFISIRYISESLK